MSDEFNPANMSPGAATGGLPNFASKLPQGAQDFIRGHLPSEDDQGVIPTFEKVPVFQTFKSKEASEKQGKDIEIWEDVTFIRISVRGNDKAEVHRPVRDEDKRRFPFAWQEYEKGQKSHAERGTQLAELGMDAPTIRQMQARNVFIVEDLALVNDIHLQNLGAGAREWRHKARAFVAARQPVAANTNEVAELRAQLAEAVGLLKAQGEQIAVLNEKRKPGRPPNPPKDAEVA